MPGLGASVQTVRLARRRVDLEHAVAVEIAHLDLVDEGIGLSVELHGVEGASSGRPEHRHDALVVGGDRDGRAAVAVEVRDLGVAHAAELPSEVLAPQRGGLERAPLELPQLHGGPASAERQDARARRPRVGERLVEDVALGVLEQGAVPLTALAVEDLQARGPRHGLPPFVHELGEREHDPPRTVGRRPRRPLLRERGLRRCEGRRLRGRRGSSALLALSGAAGDQSRDRAERGDPMDAAKGAGRAHQGPPPGWVGCMGVATPRAPGSGCGNRSRVGVGTKPPKGTRDFYPEDLRLREWLFGHFRAVARAFGFEEVDAPVLEHEELFTRKAGEEIVAQLYHFELHEHRYALRPELTPSLARMVLARRGALRLPLRWFGIPQCWRYERMQRGRRR
ncbi:MAG: hypothetical protein E4H11_01740 [Myxococcales bacterium]|nr:MAG: hypothetical protein E4H11_01740 [Myxococcales bacterium]